MLRSRAGWRGRATAKQKRHEIRDILNSDGLGRIAIHICLLGTRRLSASGKEEGNQIGQILNIDSFGSIAIDVTPDTDTASRFEE